MLEKQAKKIYLGLGSNLGNKKKNIEFAKFLLQQNNKFTIVKTSSFYKTKSYPNYKDPFFLNIVIEGETSLKPLDLFVFVKEIELKLGRKKWACGCRKSLFRLGNFVVKKEFQYPPLIKIIWITI